MELEQALDNLLGTRITVKATSKPTIEKALAYKLIGKAYRCRVEMRRGIYEKSESVYKAVDSASEWLSGKSTKPWLLIVGGMGSGKTTLANAICDVVDATSKIDTRELVWRSPFSRITAVKLNTLARTDEKEARVYSDSLRLLVDDLGTEQGNIKVYGNELSPITEMLYDRYDSTVKTTIITTNFNFPDDIEKVYGERVTDRLKEMCNFIVMTAPSFRK